MGDLHGLNTLAHQPAKIAAMEGDWKPERGAPELLFGVPNMKTGHTDYAVGIPHLGSLILTHSWNGEVPGLLSFPPDQRPFSPLIFWTFRLMVGLGFLMAAVGAVSLWLRWKRKLFEARWLQWIVLAMAPAGFVALLSGWVTTEVGRQPFTVYGVMRTADSVSPIGTPGVAVSLAAFGVVYLTVFGAGFLFLARMVLKRPERGEGGPDASQPTRAHGITPGPPAQAAYGDPVPSGGSAP